MEMIRPPVYKFSAEKIIYCSIILLFVLVFVAIACNHFQNGIPVNVLQLLFCCLLFWLIKLRNNSYTEDIPSKCYHPDLLPQTEYLTLKKNLAEADKGLSEGKQWFWSQTTENEKALLKSYQETVEKIQPILTAQNELRALCAFEMTFGYVYAPAIYKDEVENKEKSGANEYQSI